jgi:hypothetical protein
MNIFFVCLSQSGRVTGNIFWMHRIKRGIKTQQSYFTNDKIRVHRAAIWVALGQIHMYGHTELSWGCMTKHKILRTIFLIFVCGNDGYISVEILHMYVHGSPSSVTSKDQLYLDKG